MSLPRQTPITVLALGGNAILQRKQQGTFDEQYENVRSTATQIATLVDQGLRVVIVHGNGPQIGATVIRHEMGRTKVPPLPLHACGAETQGFLGYIIQQSLQDELSKRQTSKAVATVVTQVLVDRNDPAFKHPSKPIGPFYTKAQRDTLLRERSDLVIEEDSGRGYRRLVPSPDPKAVIEDEAIRVLVDDESVVIACGGGGIPVIRQGNRLQGIEAVIDETSAKIEATTKRLDSTRLRVELIDATPNSIIDKVVYLTQGKLYPDFLGIELGVAEKLLFRALARVTGQAESNVATLYKKLGDQATVAEQLFKDKTQVSFQREALSVEEIYNVFNIIAHEKGQGSIDSKLKHLTSLLGKASPTEAKYITRMALGRLRLGVADMTILDALAISLGRGKESRPTLERAYNRTSDLGYVARTLATGGMEAIESLKVTVGRPIRPMLAERLSDSKEILAKMNGECAAEYKYDGLRIQAHVSAKEITLFSRRLENITDQFPDVQQLLKNNLEGTALILEGEAVPVDQSTGELLPFQLISQRRGRKYDIEGTIKDIPVAFYPFDLLHSEEIDYTDRPYLDRRERLRRLIRKNERLDLAS